MAKMFPSEMYTPYALASGKSFTKEQMRREYSRLAAIAKKRSSRLREAGFEGLAMDVKKLADIDNADLPEALSDVAKFVRSESKTVAGAKRQRQRTIETLHEKYGIEGLNEKNFGQFTRAMDKELAKLPKNYKKRRGITAMKRAGRKIGVSVADYVR